MNEVRTEPANFAHQLREQRRVDVVATSLDDDVHTRRPHFVDESAAVAHFEHAHPHGDATIAKCGQQREKMTLRPADPLHALYVQYAHRVSS